MNPYGNSDIHAWFGRYAKHFLLAHRQEQYPVSLKITHCQRVRREAVVLGKTLSLDGHELRIVETAGLLHDIGRFEQYSRYKTFIDSISVDHAELGADVIQNHSVLDKFSATEKNRIIKAVQYHNKKVLPANEEENVALLTRIIRDADKLDIWRVFNIHNTLSKDKQHGVIDLDLPDSDTFSERAIADLTAQRMVDYKSVANKNDFALMRLGWIYDINFTHTYREIVKRDYLTSLKLSLPQHDTIDTVFKAAWAFVIDKAK